MKKRLLEVQANAALSEEARLEAEARCHVAEREKDVFRLLARRWQSRLELVLQQQRHTAASSSASLPILSVEPSSIWSESSSVAMLADDRISGEETAPILGIGATMWRIAGDEEEDDADSLNQGSLLLGVQNVHEMEEDNEAEVEEGEEQVGIDTVDSAGRNVYPHSSSRPVLATSGEEEEDSVVMDDVEDFCDERVNSRRDARTISISSDDL